jgi:hypothetical protein
MKNNRQTVVAAQNNYELWIMNYEFLGARRAPIVPRQ